VGRFLQFKSEVRDRRGGAFADDEAPATPGY
jgi:hypothetical protein